MAYSKKIIEAAFEIYTLGLSLDEVAQKLAAKWPDACGKLHRHTVAAWEKRYNWQERKRVVSEKLEAKLNDKIVSEQQVIIGQLRELQNKIFSQAQHLRAKSLEGGVNSYLGLTKQILSITGHGRGAAVEDVVSALFDVLSEDETIGPVLERRQAYFLNAIRQRLEAA